MDFTTIIIHCNVISGVKDNDNDTDKLNSFNLLEPLRYSIDIIPTSVLYQNVT